MEIKFLPLLLYSWWPFTLFLWEFCIVGLIVRVWNFQKWTVCIRSSVLRLNYEAIIVKIEIYIIAFNLILMFHRALSSNKKVFTFSFSLLFEIYDLTLIEAQSIFNDITVLWVFSFESTNAIKAIRIFSRILFHLSVVWNRYCDIHPPGYSTSLQTLYKLYKNLKLCLFLSQ